MNQAALDPLPAVAEIDMAAAKKTVSLGRQPSRTGDRRTGNNAAVFVNASDKNPVITAHLVLHGLRLSTEAASELSDGYMFFPHWPSRAVFDAAAMMVHHSSGKILASSFAARLSAAQPSKRQASEQNRLRMFRNQLISIEALQRG